MKVAFFSNFMNHHQLPFCMAMVNALGGDFIFVATKPFDQTVVSKGFEDMNRKYDFILRSYASEAESQKAMELATCCDVMIWGSAPYGFLKKRLRENKTGITFRYSERIWRENNGRINYADPFFYWNYMVNFLQSRFFRTYLLAAGAYTPYDYVRYGFSGKNIYKWGYFPRESSHTLEELLQGKASGLRIVWVGRMLALKHPEQALETAKYLKECRVAFEMRMIGEGPLLETVKEQIDAYGLSEQVVCVGSLPAETVRAEMEKAHIHLFTSDQNEGWGAVLNESMASACVPVTSVQAGASCYLIRQGENGYIYDGSVQELCRYVRELAEEEDKRYRMQTAAHKTIAATWNARQAADNFLQLSRSLLHHGEKYSIADGPCSRAEIVRSWKDIL